MLLRIKHHSLTKLYVTDYGYVLNEERVWHIAVVR